MGKLDVNKTALVLGAFVGILHAVWAVAVALGLAQPIMDFIYLVHFLNNPFVIRPFSLTIAVVLVAVTFISGYIMGWIFASLWNKLLKTK